MLTFALLIALASDSVTVCAVDARTGAPLVGAFISSEPVQSADAARSRAAVRVVAGACGRVASGLVTIRRVGYQPRTLELPPSSAPVDVLLVPLGARSRAPDHSIGVLPARLDTTRIVATTRASTAIGRMVISKDANEVRSSGAAGSRLCPPGLPEVTRCSPCAAPALNRSRSRSTAWHSMTPRPVVPM
jgi:hypothetical protein